MDSTSQPAGGAGSGFGPQRIPGQTPGSARSADAARRGAERGEPIQGEQIAFEAMLDRLGARARELRETSESVQDARNLAGAVDRARASLEDALSLSDQILEAYRQRLRVDSGQEANPPSSDRSAPSGE